MHFNQKSFILNYEDGLVPASAFELQFFEQCSPGQWNDGQADRKDPKCQ